MIECRSAMAMASMLLVERSRVTELHYITTIDNLESILVHGILCRNRAHQLPHTSIADEDVQDRRVGKRVPNGRLLHDYANTYFDARNAMMYRRRGERNDLIVLRISPSVLDIDGTVISDGNAASSGTQFLPSPAGLAFLDAERVYAQSWNHADYWEKVERKRQRQAEVLVPVGIAVGHIRGCFVRTAGMTRSCLEIATSALDVRVGKRVFFDD